MHDIGEYLRKMREYRGYSIEESAAATHISARYLRAMEDGDFQSLPGRTYAFGFLRSYVRFLDGDEEGLMAAMSEDYPDEEISPPNKSRHDGIRRPLIFEHSTGGINEVEAEIEYSEEYSEPIEKYDEMPVEKRINSKQQLVYLFLIVIVVIGLIVGAIIYLP